MSEIARCDLCGEPMPPGEQMFKIHWYSGDCPKPPKHQAPAETRETKPKAMSYGVDARYEAQSDTWQFTAGDWSIAVDREELEQLVSAATRRALADAEAEARLRGETIDALRKELAAEQENNTLIAQAANFNAALAIEELRVEALGDTLHTANDGRVRGLCANCLTWHDIGDMWAECRACFDETTGKAAQRALADVTRELDEAQQQLKGVATILNNASILDDCATLAGKALRAVSDFATSRAALEDVRRVEKWLWEQAVAGSGNNRQLYRVGAVLQLIETTNGRVLRHVRADSLEALGRALAQEAGDAAK